METLKQKLSSERFKNVLYLVGGLIVVLVIFQAGVFVGFRKASFGNRFAANYRETFGGRERGMPGFMMRDFDYPAAGGAFGKIIKINLPAVFVIGPDNVEKIILIKDDTLIRRFREEIKPADLKLNDEVIVIGSPNNSSEIEAKLIRLLPPKAPPPATNQ